MPEPRRPGRPRKHEIEQSLSIYTLNDTQVLKEHDTYLEVDISSPGLSEQIMKIDKVDYERLKREQVGRFFAKPSSYHNGALVAFVNTRKKNGEFYANASYVHNLICRNKGYLWHSNSDLLDNRRDNLETDIPLQSSTVGLSQPRPMPEAIPYDPNEPHKVINLLTGESENINEHVQ